MFGMPAPGEGSANKPPPGDLALLAPSSWIPLRVSVEDPRGLHQQARSARPCFQAELGGLHAGCTPSIPAWPDSRLGRGIFTPCSAAPHSSAPGSRGNQIPSGFPAAVAKGHPRGVGYSLTILREGAWALGAILKAQVGVQRKAAPWDLVPVPSQGPLCMFKHRHS